MDAGKWRIERRNGSDPLAHSMVERYVAELYESFSRDFDLALAAAPAPGDFEWPNGTFLFVADDRAPFACGALRRMSNDTGEIRRMWVEPTMRRRGVGTVLLRALEDVARELEMRRLFLDTNSHLTPATALYRSNGYLEVPDYNNNPFADIWLCKDLSDIPPRSFGTDT